MEPIKYDSGKVIVSNLYQEEATFIALRSMCSTKEHLRDAMIYLFLMRSPRSLYVNMPDEDRFEKLIRSHHIIDVKRLIELSKTTECKEALDFYGSLVLTPSERLRIGLLGRINEALKNLSEKVSTGGDVVASIKESTSLFDSIQKLESMVRKEKHKIKAGYRKRQYEDP